MPNASRLGAGESKLDLADVVSFSSRGTPLGLVQDVARRPPARERRGAECTESCCWVAVAGSVPQEGRGGGFIDGLRASRPVQSSRARWMVVRRGAKKNVVMLTGDV